MKIKNLLYVYFKLFAIVFISFIVVFIVKGYSDTEKKDTVMYGPPLYLNILIILVIVVAIIAILPGATTYKDRRRPRIKEPIQDVLAEQSIKDFPVQIIVFVILGGFLFSSIWILFTYSIGIVILNSFQVIIMISVLGGTIIILYGYYLWLKNKRT